MSHLDSLSAPDTVVARLQTAKGRHSLNHTHALARQPRPEDPIHLATSILSHSDLWTWFSILAQAERPAVLRTSDGTRLKARLTRDRRLLVVRSEAGVEIETPFTLHVEGPYSAFAFDVTEVDSGGIINRINSGSATRRRNFRRTFSPAGVKIAFDDGDSHQFRIVNFSLSGLCFEASADDPLPPVGRVLSFTIQWKSGATLDLEGTVTHATLDAGVAHCGVEVVTDGDSSAEPWFQEVLGLLYPHTDTPTDLDRQGIWALFDNSGYFSLSGKSVPRFVRLRDKWLECHKKLARAPHLLVQSIRRGRHHVEGTLELARVWTNAMLVYQLARRRDHRELRSADNLTLRELHIHAYEQVRHMENVEWVVGYVQHDARFSRITHHDFPKRYEAAGLAAVVPFRAIEAPTGSSGFAIDAEVTISTADLDQVNLVCECIQRCRPGPYCLAMDLTSERFRMPGLRRQWRDVDALRDRELLVAHVGGSLAAAMVLDSAEEGLHFFGLLDTCRIFPVDDDCSSRVRMALLSVAQRWFRNRQKEYFIIVDETAQPMPEAWSSQGCVDLGGADAAIMHRALIPDFLEHISLITHER